MKGETVELSQKRLQFLRDHVTSDPEMEELAMFFKLVSSPSRLKIIFLLFAIHEACVRDIAGVLDITLSAVSQHLSELKAMNQVQARRNSQTIYYSLKNNVYLDLLKPYLASTKIYNNKRIRSA